MKRSFSKVRAKTRQVDAETVRVRAKKGRVHAKKSRVDADPILVTNFLDWTTEKRNELIKIGRAEVVGDTKMSSTRKNRSSRGGGRRKNE